MAICLALYCKYFACKSYVIGGFGVFYHPAAAAIME